MLEVLVRKLEHGAELSKTDVKAPEGSVAATRQTGGAVTHGRVKTEGRTTGMFAMAAAGRG